jgi:hypothetical protein
MEFSLDIGGLIGSIATVLSLFFLGKQILAQNEQLEKQNQQILLQENKDKIEIVLKLYSDFFNNQNFQNLFEIIDQDPINNSKKTFVKLISGEQINKVKEVHLSQYMNYFNTIAILIEDGVVDKKIILKIFQYQLEKTFSHIELIKYMENFGFNKIKLLLPDVLFTYGTLSDPDNRKSIPELNESFEYLINTSVFVLNDYEIIDIQSDKIYKGMIYSINGGKVPGNLVHIKEKSNWSLIFSSIDKYEEAGELYERKIIQLNDTNDYVWVYLKKNKFLNKTKFK